jgi:hypothetical protein
VGLSHERSYVAGAESFYFGNNASLNGIATSTDGTTIYVTVTGPGNSKKGGVLALPAF